MPTLRDLRQRPADAPELLALVAVGHYGPSAAAEIISLRELYPAATAEGIARAATIRFVRQARNRGAVSGLGGPVAVLADAGTLPALHARLILTVAAAFGRDANGPGRAAEILHLLGVYDSVGEAGLAVAATMNSTIAAATDLDPVRITRPLARTLALGALRIGARRALRVLPGAGLVIGALANARATRDLLTRTPYSNPNSGGKASTTIHAHAAYTGR